jgi:Ca-activated chloride channel family protein
VGAPGGRLSKAQTSWWFGVFLCGIQLIAFQSTSAVQPQQASKPYVISSEVTLVLVPVTVRDREGQFVSDLNQSNFRLYQDGKPQQISLFRNEDVPVTVGLVVDHSASMRAKSNEVMAGALAFIRASNPQSKGFVINFSNEVIFGLPDDVPFTNDPQQMEMALSTAPMSGATALYDALAAALQHLQGGQSDKKVLLLISDGGDNASEHTFGQILRMAQSGNATIYTIGLFDDDSADQNPRVLRKLANETGGESYFPNSASEVVSICQNIAADIRHQYDLAYTPLENERGGYHKIHVTVTAPERRKLFVRSRIGYFFPSGGSESLSHTR